MPLVATRGAASAQGFGEFGAVTAPAVYIEDVFSTYLYTGNGSTQTITNGIDLAGKGGLIWIKNRADVITHSLHDTVRGLDNYLRSDSTSQSISASFNMTALSNGFSQNNSFGQTNRVADGLYVSWTFRKQAKFFDVVTYTGNGSNRTISHNLGSVPGCIIVKRTDTTADWQVYHRSFANTEYIVLNSTAAKATGTTRWNSTTPTSTVFSLGTDTTVNANGGTYVAYLFAHNAGGFGLSGTDNVISCGYAAGGTTVNLGYEPQWVLTKDPNSVSNWLLVDNMRGMPAVGGAAKGLLPNTSDAESDWSGYVHPTSTGFYNGVDAIYIAIRRGPMKVPTSGTSVFDPSLFTATQTTNFPVDSLLQNFLAGDASNTEWYDRLRGVSTTSSVVLGPRLITSSAAGEGNSSFGTQRWTNTSYNQTLGSGAIYYAFRRAPGFFDVVAYTGTGANRTVNHNLAAVPQLMIIKSRSAGADWAVYSEATTSTGLLQLNTNVAKVSTGNRWNSTAPTASVFSVGITSDVNTNGTTYVAYLFASAPGVSKVGSYTGTGTTKQIDCGFTGGARFVLIKRTDSTGDWYVWDTARGIVASTDPYLVLNSTAAQVTNTDWVDTYSAGFELSSAAGNNVNINGASYIFLSIA